MKRKAFLFEWNGKAVIFESLKDAKEDKSCPLVLHQLYIKSCIRKDFEKKGTYEKIPIQRAEKYSTPDLTVQSVLVEVEVSYFAVLDERKITVTTKAGKRNARKKLAAAVDPG